MARKGRQKLTVLISSSVYGREPLLEQMSAWLATFGYEVWNSHLGTLPVTPNRSSFESCIEAAAQCDIFLGLITPRYGSGTDGKGGRAITHLEFDKAIELDKPRFVLAHQQVLLARSLLKDLALGSVEARSRLKLRKGATVIDDLRIIDMYEAATQEDKPIPERNNNWVQKYDSDADVKRYVDSQFSRYRAMVNFVDDWRARKSTA